MRVVGLVVAASLVAAATSAGAAEPHSRTASPASLARYFDVPAAAFSNRLGGFPAIADCGTQVGNSTQPDVPATPVTGPTPVRTGPCPAGGAGTNAFAYN